MSVVAITILVLISIALLIILTTVIKLNAFVSLFGISLLLAVITLPDKNIIDILKQGFGTTLSSIGLLIIPGAIIAVILEKTGAAFSIANYLLKVTGIKNAAAAMGITGFIGGMPIFCDSGFIILSGLAKSFSARSGIAITLVAFVLATSLYSVHCLIPTHPGALAAAGILDVNIGKLILLGILFAFPGALAAFYWIKWKTSRRFSENINQPSIEINATIEDNLPSVFKSLLPVIIPLLLISLGAILKLFSFSGDSSWLKIISFTSNPVIALFAGVLSCFPLLKNKSVKSLNPIFESAIEKAGPILIVTAAGGMFGLVIKETGVGIYAGDLLVKTGLGIAVPFLISSVLKTAQGSSTVAIITAASFVAPMLPALGLDSETGKLFTMLSMGAGSMMISHANDSYFWVVSRFSGIPVNITLKIYSTATIMMGMIVFLCVYFTSLFFL